VITFSGGTRTWTTTIVGVGEASGGRVAVGGTGVGEGISLGGGEGGGTAVGDALLGRLQARIRVSASNKRNTGREGFFITGLLFARKDFALRINAFPVIIGKTLQKCKPAKGLGISP
jgi:hypothetical protein